MLQKLVNQAEGQGSVGGRSNWVGTVGLAVAVGLAYFIAARFGLALRAGTGPSVFWPAAGISVGALIVWGPAARVPVSAGVVVATAVSNLMIGRNTWLAIAFGFVNAGQALLTTGLIERWFGRSTKLGDVSQVLGFLLAAAIGAAVGAMGATIAFGLVGSSGSPFTIWRVWFASGLLGIVTVAPLLVGIAEAVRNRLSRRELVEGAVGVVVLVALSAFVISMPDGPWSTALPVALVFPVLLWVAVRCRPAFSAAAAFVVALTVIGSLTFSVGHFGDARILLADRILAAQTIVLTGAVLTLVLAALFAERRRYEASILASETRLRSLLGALPAAVYVTDAAGHITYCNQGAVDLWGVEPRLGKDRWSDFSEFHHVDGSPMALADCPTEIALKHGRIVRDKEAILKRKDGTRIPIIPYPTPLRDETGAIVGVVNMTVDISERKAEEALRNQTHRLQTLNRLSKSISNDLDLERIVQTATDIATELSGAKFGAFFYNVVDDKGEQYLLYTLSGAPREAFAPLGLPRNTAIFAATFGGTGVVRSDDIRADPRYGRSAPHFGMPNGHLPVVSYLAVPVVSRTGQVHGGLFFGHDRPAIFTKEAEDIVRGIAAHAANAIDNARVLEAAEAEIAERRRAEELQRQRAEGELKESEGRLQEALAAGQVMAFEWDRRMGQSHRSDNAAEILGYEPGLTAGRLPNDFLARVHPDDSSRFKAHIRGLRPDNPSYAVSFRYVRPDGHEVWLEETARGQFDADGRCVRLKGLTRNITERKRAEKQQSLLIAELDHRVKNTLATVSSVTSRTQEASASMADFVAALDGRIKSMAATHRLLSSQQWKGILLSDLVHRELAPYAVNGNTEMGGPEVMLNAEAAQAVSMVLHELATNAAKHGALSTRDGRVCVRWRRVLHGDADAPLRIEWQESGGPPVLAPDHSGYGMEVIRDLLPYELDGKVDLAFAAEGVRCRFDIPVSELTGLEPVQR